MAGGGRTEGSSAGEEEEEEEEEDGVRRESGAPKFGLFPIQNKSPKVPNYF